ncbi:hypothetical protein [Parasphingopyxis marina]|uniref:Uncharacterized protein n=1 Tax=Parasphingopyxis marina TaxID=2761622 RepID=A0A842HWT7_9SPHN|nr:hypothetical protein [Parasphingopyxis marina]MBC2776410.1 hypothetical protein [Parasphingopyxis marina]
MRFTPPIRFVAGVLTLWIGVRLSFWFAAADAPQALPLPIPGFPPLRRAEAESPISDENVVRNPARAAPHPRPFLVLRDPYARPAMAPAPGAPARSARRDDRRRQQMWIAAFTPSFAQPMLMRFARRPLPADSGYHNRAEEYSPWRVAFWGQWRSGSGPRALAEGGELGGSQAGVRVQYSLGRTRRTEIAAIARASRPLEGADGGEAAIGLALRPSPDIPLEILAERRIAIERGGRNAWSLGAAAGLYRRPLPFGLEFDGYAQAGIVGLDRRDLFVDANAAVTRPIRVAPHTTLSIGGAAWAAAQPGASRVDIGPEAVLRLPAAEGNVRLSLSWRERVAGSASPGSGPALTLGADF